MKKNLMRGALVIGALTMAMAGLSGCYVSDGPVRVSSAPAAPLTARTDYYTPQYYNGYVVYYNNGVPFYYLNGQTIYVPSTYAY